MLRHLHIRNYALIRSLDIDFNEGFSVLTGETGAGKSIILGALNLVMGARADLTAITEGESLCVIEAEFDSVSPVDKGDIVIRRELHASGRSRSFVNDEVISQADLRALAARLIDIHSQHANLLLADDSFRLTVVDSIAQNSPLREAYTTAYEAHVEAARALSNLREMAARSRKDADYVQFQFHQLDEANLVEGEMSELEQEQHMLANATEILQRLGEAHHVLDNDEGGIVSALRSCRLADVDSSLQQRIDSTIIELRDILESIDHLYDSVEVNPTRLAEVEDRLDTLYTLCRKFNVQTVDELIALRDQLGQQMEAIDSFDDRIAALEKEEKAAYQTMVKAAEALTESRLAVRQSISLRLIESCRTLGIAHANLDIAVTPLASYTPSGHDDVQILFAANLGQSLHPISNIASGGELSRVMLSVKALIASTNGLPTILFDEIDTGVSGEIATRMGAIMKQMGTSRQIIAISHLAQVAVQAEQQYLVYKQDENDHTETHIRLLSPAEREQYIHDFYATISRAIASQDAQ